MAYTDVQEMLTLSFLSYAGFYETDLGLQSCVRSHRIIADALKRAAPVAGKWKLVWGPAVHKVPISVFDENLMFVVQSTATPSRYAIVIRGTNPVSVTNWVLQDFSVARQKPWPHASLDAPDAATPKLSLGSARGLHALKGMKAEDGLPGTGLSLARFLTEEVQRNSAKQLSITVTGHSLGGALAPVVGLWLHETQGEQGNSEQPGWDPSRKVTLQVIPFAGPSPGNAAFARYYDERLGAQTKRFWNPLDVVPHGWAEETLRALPGLYAPEIKPNLVMKIVLHLTLVLAGGRDYQQINEKSPPAEGSKVADLLRDYAAQLVYQHSVAYLELFGIWKDLDEWFDGATIEDANGKPRELSALHQKLFGSQPGWEHALARGAHRLYRVPVSAVVCALPLSLVTHRLRLPKRERSASDPVRSLSSGNHATAN